MPPPPSADIETPENLPQAGQFDGSARRSLPPPRLDATAGPEGLGGWMILPLIGLTLTPFVALYDIFDGLSAIESLENLERPDVFWIAVAVDLLWAAFSAVVLVQAFRKHRSFPKYYLAWGLTSLTINTLYVYWINSTLNIPFETDDYKQIARSIGICAIWVPYMFFSRRAKNTFGPNLQGLQRTFD